MKGLTELMGGVYSPRSPQLNLYEGDYRVDSLLLSILDFLFLVVYPEYFSLRELKRSLGGGKKKEIIGQVIEQPLHWKNEV